MPENLGVLQHPQAPTCLRPCLVFAAHKNVIMGCCALCWYDSTLLVWRLGFRGMIWSYHPSKPTGMIVLLLIIVAWPQGFQSCACGYVEMSLWLGIHHLKVYVWHFFCWLLFNNQSFYRQIASCGMGVGDHRVGWCQQNSCKTIIEVHSTMYVCIPNMFCNYLAL